jgi:uncharacterized protein (TIGR02246 family)
MNLRNGFAVIALVGLVGCTQAPAPPPPDTREADTKTIKDDEVAWNKDWAARDADKIASHYADDAMLLIPDIPIQKTKDDIKNTLKQVLADPNWSISFENDKVDVAKSGDMAYVQGHYTITATDEKSKKKVTEQGKFVTVYKKQADGSWKAAQDINNENAPPKS